MSAPSGGVIHGIATWYGIVDGFTSADTMADGNQFDPYDPTITASNSFPFGTWLSVCHADRCINVCVHDRGAFTHALDLSMAAFASLAPLSNGVIDVTIQVIG
jgi:rare lipoprotein A (peptidoglycan hydrolase)